MKRVSRLLAALGILAGALVGTHLGHKAPGSFTASPSDRHEAEADAPGAANSAPLLDLPEHLGAHGA